MNEVQGEPNAGQGGSGRRVRRALVVGSLVLLAVVAIAGFLLVRHTTHHLNAEGSDSLLCAQASSSLNLARVPDPSPIVLLRISHTTAGDVAAEMSTAHADPHPWDQEPSGTRVVLCQSGTLKWVVDAHGHAARLPGT